MKKIFIITTMLIFGKVFSQFPILTTSNLSDVNQELNHTNNGNYAIDINNERDQYVGTWKYDSGTGTIFEIKITKKDQAFHGVIYRGELYGNYYYMDDVYVQYKLTVNNTLIYNNLMETNLNNIRGSGYKYGSMNYLHGSIIDEITKVGVRYEIYKTSSTSPEKIIFKAQRGTMYKLYPKTNITAPDGTPSFLPMEEIEMIKIN